MKPFITLTKKGLLAILAVLIIFLIILGQIFSADSSKIDGSTNALRIKYLESLSVTADDTNVSSKNIIIPREFDTVYTEYNALQKKAGFDLTHHKGDDATVYTYPLKDENTFAHLIVCEGEIIGGDIASVELDGEMKPLIKE